MHAASDLFSWGMELLVFASRQFAPKTVDTYVRFTRIMFYLRFRSISFAI